MNSITTLVSIIIPSFNNIENLKECIRSIDNQVYDNYEVWIIDNKSTDGTEDFIKTLQAPFYWVFEKDLGVYDAMNKGVQKANGDWLYFLGCDDRLFNSLTLENLFKIINIPEKTDLVIGRVQYDLYGDESYFLRRKGGITSPVVSRKLWAINTMHHQAIFYRKEIFDKLIFSLKYKILSDYDFNIKLFKSGVNELIINDIIAICKTQGLSKKYNWNLYKEEIEFKTANSSIFLKPLFYILGLAKYFIKKSI